MKAFLLAAGNGTRLTPLTDNLPKCLLPIRGVPLLGIWLELCRRYGVDEVLINTHAHPNAVRDYLNNARNGIRVKVFEEPTLLGSAGTIAANRDWVAREPFFWILYADVLTNVNLRAMLGFHSTHTRAATLGVYRVPDPSRCGVVTVDERGLVTEFVEKPSAPASNLVFSGVLIGTGRLLEQLPDTAPADVGFHLLGRLINDMAAYEIREYALDVGTVANYMYAQVSWPGL